MPRRPPELIEGGSRLCLEHGAKVLKIPYPGSAEACAAVTRLAGDVPWAVLSAGVDHETFLGQVEIAMANGASGVIAGRSLWKDCISLDRAVTRRAAGDHRGAAAARDPGGDRQASRRSRPDAWIRRHGRDRDRRRHRRHASARRPRSRPTARSSPGAGRPARAIPPRSARAADRADRRTRRPERRRHRHRRARAGSTSRGARCCRAAMSTCRRCALAARIEERFGRPVTIDNDAQHGAGRRGAAAAPAAARGISRCSPSAPASAAASWRTAASCAAARRPGSSATSRSIRTGRPASAAGAAASRPMSSGTALGGLIRAAGLPEGTTAAELIERARSGDDVGAARPRRLGRAAAPGDRHARRRRSTVERVILGGGLGREAAEAVALLPAEAELVSTRRSSRRSSATTPASSGPASPRSTPARAGDGW